MMEKKRKRKEKKKKNSKNTDPTTDHFIETSMMGKMAKEIAEELKQEKGISENDQDPSAFFNSKDEGLNSFINKVMNKVETKIKNEEISPFINEWDEAQTFPRELYKKAADIGLLGVGFDENYGGIAGTDAFYILLASVELAKCA